ncbi:putative gpi-anchored cell surface glyco protein [Rosellinia necatrix]|uniref:Putative gpi-anchored cell surface glyco protein n=1 Tax=Rosellinia necatrix TaxID=77044 RepID=A0A1W2TN00_ROSNE|nr:putative gpi-anchored cell surface glyco protein [Rosellinia necatrix]
MSLNGLDDVKVKEAHDAAKIETGGWFLLKYASRDEIDILDSGNGGITDIRSAIARYEEPSPLYGFLRYRRRSVIIKYIPEDCSRLVQARAAVHFNAICDYFPHNTTFEIGVAKDLKDSKLSAACSLHAASGSSSSSTSSLRRRRLNEIAEEEEEEERERKRQSVVKEEDRPTSSIYSDAPTAPSSPEAPVVLDRQQITDPPENAFASTKNVPDFVGVSGPASPTRSEFGGRLSSQSSRYEGYGSPYSQGRKVKLGPRPSIEAHKRPSTAENFRPVAALPAGFKFFKGSKKGKTHEQGQGEGIPTTAPVSDPLLQSPDDQLPPRPATSSGASIKSMAPSVAPSIAASMAPVREGKITPEKARLMKAMKLREKRMQDAKSGFLTPAEQQKPIHNDETTPNIEPSNPHGEPTPNVGVSTDLSIAAISKPEADSKDNALDSHPSSPGAASSTGIGDSTKASSLSDLTDETIQAPKEAAEGSEEETNEDTVDLVSNGNVSAAKFTKDAEESTQIPESTTLPSASAHVDTGLGDDHNIAKEQLGMLSSSTSNETKPSTTTISPTPSLKSKFSRTDVTVPTELAHGINDEVPAPPTADHESPKQDVDLKNRPEILLASPPNLSRQKATVERIRTDLTTQQASQVEPSDPLDDDALMDELQTATLQEAKPMLVSKSPITPVFPSPGSPPKKDARVPRAASNPMRGSLLMPVDLSQGNTARSVSSGGSPFVNSLTRNPSNASMQSKKSNVGSSISQRIKALEALSGNPNEERARPTTPSSTFFTVRKQSTRDASKSSSAIDRASAAMPPPPTPERSRDPTPETPDSKRERSSSVASRLTMFEGQNAPRGRPESVQVTARIIRGATAPFTNVGNASRKPGDAAPAELRQSTLLVDIHRAQSMKPQPLAEQTSVVERPKTSVSEVQVQPPRPEVINKQAKRRSSMSLMKNFIKEHTPLSNKSTETSVPASPGATPLKSPNRPPSVHQTSTSFARRLSTSSRRSSFNREADSASISGATRSSSRLSDSGSAEDDKSLSDKKSKNRTSRFMRRLSNSFGGATRKSGSASISPTVTEEEADQLEKAPILAQQKSSSPTIVAFMGDVNVQFPDNLLWKRRSMCLDAQGFLFLSTVQGGAKKAKESVGTKRFHLGDFRKPYIPDVEVQELPNSVLLDFTEGSCLQIACGDRAEQQNILRTLQEAHQSHAAGRS